MSKRVVMLTNATDEPTPVLRQQRLTAVPIRVGGVQILPGGSASVPVEALALPHVARLLRAEALVVGVRKRPPRATPPRTVDKQRAPRSRDDRKAATKKRESLPPEPPSDKSAPSEPADD